jgi:nucleoside-diphosphate-sugar epimerase
VPYLVRELKAGQPALLGNGGQIRDFIHVDDICRIVIKLAEMKAPEFGLVHVGTGRGVRLSDVCETVADVLKADRSLLRFGHKTARAIDQDVLISDTTRLAKLTSVPHQHWPTGTIALEYVTSLTAAWTANQ